MSLNLIHLKPLSSTSASSSIFHSSLFNTLSKPFLLLESKTSFSSLSLRAAQFDALHSSTTPISLPHLQQSQHQEDTEEEEEEGHDPDDPNYNFSDSDAWISSQDPQDEEKLYIEENPFTSWHIDEEPEMSLEIEEMGSCQSRELREAEGVVGEIVQLARNLPQNLTLEEALGEYEGRVNEKDCWEVLEILGEERLLLCCVCFFRWMRLQEPSLVTPRACIVLFPLLGKGGMGDEVMGLFESLPSSMEFRDVHVYNATILGLLYGGRYTILAQLYGLLCFFLAAFVVPRTGKISLRNKDSNQNKKCLDLFLRFFKLWSSLIEFIDIRLQLWFKCDCGDSKILDIAVTISLRSYSKTSVFCLDKIYHIFLVYYLGCVSIIIFLIVLLSSLGKCTKELCATCLLSYHSCNSN